MSRKEKSESHLSRWPRRGAAPVVVRGGVVGAVAGVLGLLVQGAGLGVLDERLGVEVGGLLSVVDSESARQLTPECRQWTTRTSRMTYKWCDNRVKRVTAWSKARAQNRILCVEQLINKFFSDSISFRFDDPKFLEIVVECLYVHGSTCSMNVPPTKTISLIFQPLFSPSSAFPATFSRILTRMSC